MGKAVGGSWETTLTSHLQGGMGKVLDVWQIMVEGMDCSLFPASHSLWPVSGSQDC